MNRKWMWAIIFMAGLTACSLLPQQTKSNKTSTIVPDVLLSSPAQAAGVCPTCPPAPTCAAKPTNTSQPPATKTPAVSKTSTATVVPSKTPTITKTTIPTKIPTRTLTSIPTKTATAVPMPFALQPNSPVYLQNFAHPDRACGWVGVAGQVFDLNGKPISNLVVVAEGTLGGKIVDGVGLTGLNKAYGPGGYEIEIGSTLVDSTGTVKVSLYGLDGVALATQVSINTYNDCKKNLILVNYVQKK